MISVLELQKNVHNCSHLSDELQECQLSSKRGCMVSFDLIGWLSLCDSAKAFYRNTVIARLG